MLQLYSYSTDHLHRTYRRGWPISTIGSLDLENVISIDFLIH